MPCKQPVLGEMDMKKAVMGCHGTPMFHALGAFMYAASVSLERDRPLECDCPLERDCPPLSVQGS